jgi:site-specific DNA-methyltransferase (adenine-specific)
MLSSATRRTEYGTTACSWDTVIPFAPMWAAIRHVIKPRAAVVLFGSQPFTSALVMSNVECFKYEWVWDKVSKGDIFNAKNKPLKQHENILIFSDGTTANCSDNKMRYHPQGVGSGTRSSNQEDNYNGAFVARRPSHKPVHFCDGSNYPSSIIEFSNADRSSRFHPTQKPVPLLEYLIRTYTNPGDTVLDFTCGSGSTGVAAMQTGRKFIGIDNGHCEKEGYYYGRPWVDVAHDRIANAAGDYRPTRKDPAGQLSLLWDAKKE